MQWKWVVKNLEDFLYYGKVENSYHMTQENSMALWHHMWVNPAPIIDLPLSTILTLQRVVNAAAILIYLRPVLTTLHWLPLNYWVKFKVVLIVDVSQQLCISELLISTQLTVTGHISRPATHF